MRAHGSWWECMRVNESTWELTRMHESFQAKQQEEFEVTSTPILVWPCQRILIVDKKGNKYNNNFPKLIKGYAQCFRQNLLKRSFCHIAFIWECNISHQYPNVKKNITRSARYLSHSFSGLDVVKNNNSWSYFPGRQMLSFFYLVTMCIKLQIMHTIYLQFVTLWTVYEHCFFFSVL